LASSSEDEGASSEDEGEEEEEVRVVERSGKRGRFLWRGERYTCGEWRAKWRGRERVVKGGR
jgi:hypothetical protein